MKIIFLILFSLALVQPAQAYSRKYYLRNTQTEAGTTGTPAALGSILDLSITQGATATLGSGSLGDFTDYETVPCKQFTITVNAGTILDGLRTYSYSIKIPASTDELFVKWKFKRVNSSGVTQDESDYSPELSSGGIDVVGTWTGNIAWDPGTWELGDRLVLSVHGYDDGPGSQNFTFDVNDAASYIEAEVSSGLQIKNGTMTIQNGNVVIKG